jgi:selenocysteine lyase/cysteine desulfurase
MTALSRRRFARLLALSASGAALSWPAAVLDPRHLRTGLPPRAPQQPDEAYWEQVRARFLLPRDFAFLNAANLCPTPLPVLEALDRYTRQLDADPSPTTRALLGQGRENTRRLLAELLGATPEEIVITRNTSEANNLVSSGLQLGPGDEVVVFADNHPSNLAAWREKSARFGFTVTSVPVVTPHPGAEYYLDAFRRALTPRTRVVAFTHVTNSVGDLLPAAELCHAARDRGVLSLVDGAQSFGVLEVHLPAMRPDFYTGSAHKWLCGPKETGLLYVNREVHDLLHPTVVSLYPGAVGISRKLEGMGQRDEAALAALGEAVKFQLAIGPTAIERRARQLAAVLLEGLGRHQGVTLWSHPDPARSGPVVTFRPGALNPSRLAETLYHRERIACAVRAGDDRPGIRFSPHLYNTLSEVERVVATVRRYLASGL